MSLSYFLLLLILTAHLTQEISSIQDDPEKLSACKARLTSTGEIIDLSSLDNSNQPKTATYESQTYKFNPCKFSLDDFSFKSINSFKLEINCPSKALDWYAASLRLLR